MGDEGSIFQYNGSAIIGMAGKNCVAIAADSRFGVQQRTIARDMKKVFKMNDRVFFGLAGLATDMQTMYELMKFRTNLYKLKEERDIQPKSFLNMVAAALYARRYVVLPQPVLPERWFSPLFGFGPYFVEPLIVGLEPDNTPFIAGTDVIGAIEKPEDFLVVGSDTDNLFGICESMYRPDMEPEDLFETISQCLLNAMDREAMSGWGAEVTIITPDGVTTRRLKTRQD